MRPIAIVLLAGGCWTSSQPAPRESAPVEPPPKAAVAPEERFDQSTPRKALFSFLRAIELERYDVALRFVPMKYRERMNETKMREQLAIESTREMLAVLREHRNAHIDENGDEARMHYGNGLEVRFVREDGVWRIQDLD